MPTSNPDTAPSGMLERALTLHRSGKLSEARPLYERLLRLDPHDGDTLHYLGVLLYQCGDNERAEALIREAISNNGAVADYLNHLGEVLRAELRFEEAESCGASQRVILRRPSRAPRTRCLATTFILD